MVLCTINEMTMRIKLFSLLLMLIAGTYHASAQKFALKEGDLSALKGMEKINIRFVYDDMTVTTKNIPEDQFIEEKTEEYNKKEAGKGTTWSKAWISDRKARFEPRFIESFEDATGISAGEFPDAPYTLIFHTTHSETGYNIGISRRNAYIDGTATIVATKNPSQTIAKISVDNAPGRIFGGFDFDTGTRLQECYAVAGKKLGVFLKKRMK